MKVCFEISLYPLEKDYKSIILDFIERLRAHPSISTYTTEMSTYIKGDWDVTMPILQKELGAVFQEFPNSSTFIKIIPQDLPIEKGFRTF